MVSWHFYQGFKDEWRWYHLDDHGNILRESDQGFAELRACMANAERAGFTRQAFHVYARPTPVHRVGATPNGPWTRNHRTEQSAADEHAS